MPVLGVTQIENAIAEKMASIDGATQEGLYAAGLLIESAAIDKTPKDLGNLRQSFYVAPDGSEIGNTADYAAAVHEDLEAHHEVGEAKYLERAINENEDKIFAKIAEFAEGGI